MEFSEPAWERAMQMRELILKAVSGEIHWFRAAEILGISVRTLRRWRERHERLGYKGLFDLRRRKPSPRQVPLKEVEKIVRLYRESHLGWNVRHFHSALRREHGVKQSYTFVKHLLQDAGLVKRKRARGPHRMRREPRPCFGEMLLIDGSKHAWLALVPEERQVLISVVDDATSRLLYAQLWEGETTVAILSALKEVIRQNGIPAALYSDRAKWAFETPKAGGPVSKLHLTRVGEVLKRLGIEHIPSYSPQARGRSERVHGTLQDRLVKELKRAQIDSLDTANRYIRERYLGVHNAEFSRQPADPSSAFVTLGKTDLETIFFETAERQVGKDNTLTYQGVRLQLAPQPGRRTCAGLMVTVRRQLDGQFSVWRGPLGLGFFDRKGLSLADRKQQRTMSPAVSRSGRLRLPTRETAAHTPV
jgi:transposase